MSSTPLRTLKLYSSDYRKHPWYVASSLLLGPGFVLQNIISPLFIAKIIGQLSTHTPLNPHYIWYAATAMIGGASLAFIGDRYGSMPLTAITTRDLYLRCFKQLLQQDYDFFANSFAGSLVTQTNRFVKGYELFVNTLYLEMLGVWSGALTAIGIMTYYNPTLGLSVGLLWVISIIIVGLRVRKRIPVRRRAVNKETELTGTLADVISNAITVKTFAHETTETERYDSINGELLRRLHTSWRMAIRNHYTVQMLCIILQLLVIIGGVHGVQHGSLTIGTFLLFQLYALRIIDSIAKASMEMRLLEGIFGDAGEMTELLDRTPSVIDLTEPETPQISRGHIKLKDVSFGYHTSDKKSQDLFENFNLEIKAGERIGLVGPSGGGKTTITKLILRFMDVQSGTITIDDQAIDHITQDALHASVSYVPQEPLLFHRSLLENIGYGKPGASKAEIIKAAKRAFAHDFIVALPNGYDTMVGERGIKLSGGQRQRVAIARAMLKNAPILILDEATSALDSESERYIQDALWQLMQDKTSVVIAHRLSTIQHLDRIIVLDDGKVLEQGSHKTLLAKKGLYAKLWQHQSGGFIEE